MIEAKEEDIVAIESLLAKSGYPKSWIFVQQIGGKKYVELIESRIPEEDIRHARNIVWKTLVPRMTCGLSDPRTS